MKRILVVDDVKGWRDLNTHIIKKLYGEDAEIICADSAHSAYNILLEQKPLYAIITDLQMEKDYEPKHAGEWLVEQIKTFKCYLNTKVIIISASYNIRHIADSLGVFCIPKSTAINCLSAYNEILNN